MIFLVLVDNNNTARLDKTDKSYQRPLGLRPNVHTIHPKFYTILVISNTT